MSLNVYEAGDYVFCETAPSVPFLIAKIEKFNKTREGNVLTNVRCFCRRRDIPDNLIAVADKNLLEPDDEGCAQAIRKTLNGIKIHQLKQRELFLTDKTERLHATQIKGKCRVNFFIDTDCLQSYLESDDAFFYILTYDHMGKRLVRDKRHVRIGSRYQADIPQIRGDDLESKNLESLVWNPDNNLNNMQIEQFLLLTRAVGTFARAVDRESADRSPFLLTNAASASRDVSLQYAMDSLHKNKYNLSDAMTSLVPPGGPVLCKDELEVWSAAEAHIFEEGLALYDKDFSSIREQMLPWKPLKSIVEYYYMWKASDRYLKHSKQKALSKIYTVKKVCIPVEWNGTQKRTEGAKKFQPDDYNNLCPSCNSALNGQLFLCQPEQRKVCGACWIYWKKYGGFKHPLNSNYGTASQRFYRCRFRLCLLDFTSKLELARHYTRDHGADLRYLMSTQNNWKRPSAFYLKTTPLTRFSRRFCRYSFKPRTSARSPFKPINVSSVKQESFLRMVGKSSEELKRFWVQKARKRCLISDIINRLHFECASKNV